MPEITYETTVTAETPAHPRVRAFLNVPLLVETRDRILEDAGHFAMQRFVQRADVLEPFERLVRIVDLIGEGGRPVGHACNTACCIAGWAGILAMQKDGTVEHMPILDVVEGVVLHEKDAEAVKKEHLGYPGATDEVCLPRYARMSLGFDKTIAHGGSLDRFDMDQLWHDLIQVRRWPDSFYEAYRLAERNDDRRGMALAAARRIDYLITEGY